MKIYTAVFRPWHAHYAWFGRDSGLVTEGLRRIGIESRLVILDTPGMDHDERFLTATREQFLNPHFWRSHGLDAVVLQGGGDVGIEPVSAAIKQSGATLLLRLDTDGVVGPQVDPYLYCYNLWWWLAFRRRHPALLLALGKTGLKAALPKSFGPGRIVQRLQYGDYLLAESRIAAARLRRLLQHYGAYDTAQRVLHLPIPVADEWTFSEGSKKADLIVSVARWDDAQKDAPKMVKTLALVLSQHSHYRALLIGNGDDILRKLISRYAPHVANRIQLTGRMPHLEIPPYNRAAKIFLCSSRAESMNIASAEALCCGCSIVGPAEIASMHEYTSAQSGTLAWTRRTIDFSDAVSAEILAWTQSEREAGRISAHFRNCLGCENIAKALAALSCK